MREFGTQNTLNKRLYFIFCTIAVMFMVFGLLTTFLRHEYWIKVLIQCLFVMTVSGLAVTYPFKETNLHRALLMYAILCYFYTLFLLYPETVSSIALFYFAPTLSILFFNRKIFNSIILSNLVIGTSLMIGLSYCPYREIYSAVTQDVVGNLINFWVCETMIYIIFAFMAKRIDRVATYYQKIQQAERLNTIGQLAASVAHEIRNPLTVVRGFLLLSNEKPLSQSHLKLMIEELDHAEIIIQEYLSLLKPQYSDHSHSDVAIEVKAVTDLLYPFAVMSKNDIHVDLVEGLMVKVPAIEIKQVLTNIIKNALEAMEEMSGTIEVSGFKTNNWVVIRVKDSGVGMTEKEVKELGTPFYSLKKKGTGIGLTVCYDIVDKYKGKINIHSEKSIGTTVQISLPLHSE